MQSVWQWGLALIVAIQSVHGPVLDGIFRAVSSLGEEAFYLLLFPALLWCVDVRFGFRLGLLFLVSVYVNSLVKDLVAHPRPFDLDPSVKLIDAQGYGLPSGHAQEAVVIWGGVAVYARKRWVWVAAIVLAGLIGFSRIYLGAHFPTDVLAGWAIGAALLLVWLSLYDRTAAQIARWPLLSQIALAVAVPTAFAILFPDTGAITATGALAGVGAGHAVRVRYVRVSAQGPWWQRAVRFLVGAAVMAGIYLGLRAVSPAQGEPLHLLFRFVRFGAVGLWIGLGAPWVFRLLRLAPRPAIRIAAAPAG